MIFFCSRKDELVPIYGRGAPTSNEKSETHKKKHLEKFGVMVLKPG